MKKTLILTAFLAISLAIYFALPTKSPQPPPPTGDEPIIKGSSAQLQTVKRGRQFEVFVQAEGGNNARPLNYEWTFQSKVGKKGNKVSNHNGSNFVIQAVKPDDSGKYTVKVSNQHGKVEQAFELEVIELNPPQIKKDLASEKGIDEWESVIFDVDAEGDAALNYQLEFKANAASDFKVVIGKQSTNRFEIRRPTFADSGYYRLGVFYEGGTPQYSKVQKLSVNKAPAPSFVNKSQIKPVSIKLGQKGFLPFPFNANGHVECKWESFGDDGQWMIVPRSDDINADSKSGRLEILKMDQSFKGRYRLTVSNLTGSATSPEIKLEVAPFEQARFTDVPTDTINLYRGEKLEVKGLHVSGDPEIAVSWEFSRDGKVWQSLDSTGLEFSRPNMKSKDAGFYRAKGVNPGGTNYSDSIKVDVKPLDIVVNIFFPEEGNVKILYMQSSISAVDVNRFWSPFAAKLDKLIQGKNIKVRLRDRGESTLAVAPRTQKDSPEVRQKSVDYEIHASSFSGALYLDIKEKIDPRLAELVSTISEHVPWGSLFGGARDFIFGKDYWPKIRLDLTWRLRNSDGFVETGTAKIDSVAAKINTRKKGGGDFPSYEEVMQAVKERAAFPFSDSAELLAAEVMKDLGPKLDELKKRDD